MSKIKKLAQRTAYSMSHFTEDPKNLGFLVPVLMVAISVVVSLVGYIQFIVQGGYSAQMDLMEDHGATGLLTQGFTSGSSGLSQAWPLALIVLFLFLVQLGAVLAEWFKTAAAEKRIIMKIDFAILAVLVCLFAFFYILSGLTVEQVQAIDPSFDSLAVSGSFWGMVASAPSVLAIAIAIALLPLCVFVARNKESRGLLIGGLIGLGANFIVAPLLVLLLENALPLGIGFLLALVVGFILLVLFGSSESAEYVPALLVDPKDHKRVIAEAEVDKNTTIIRSSKK